MGVHYISVRQLRAWFATNHSIWFGSIAHFASLCVWSTVAFFAKETWKRTSELSEKKHNRSTERAATVFTINEKFHLHEYLIEWLISNSPQSNIDSGVFIIKPNPMNIHLSLLGLVVVVVGRVAAFSLFAKSVFKCGNFFPRTPSVSIFLRLVRVQSINRTLRRMTVYRAAMKKSFAQIILNIHFILGKSEEQQKKISINRCRMTLRFSNFSFEHKFSCKRFCNWTRVGQKNESWKCFKARRLRFHCNWILRFFMSCIWCYNNCRLILWNLVENPFFNQINCNELLHERKRARMPKLGDEGNDSLSLHFTDCSFGSFHLIETKIYFWSS